MKLSTTMFLVQACFFVLISKALATMTNFKTPSSSGSESSSSSAKPLFMKEPRDPPLDPCSKLTQFAKDVAVFTQCSITFHPSLCRKCIDEINRVTSSYVQLENMLHDPKAMIVVNKSSCAETILTDSTMDVINEYYTHARGFWIMANCDSEYKMTHLLMSLF